MPIRYQLLSKGSQPFFGLVGWQVQVDREIALHLVSRCLPLHLNDFHETWIPIRPGYRGSAPLRLQTGP